MRQFKHKLPGSPAARCTLRLEAGLARLVRRWTKADRQDAEAVAGGGHPVAFMNLRHTLPTTGANKEKQGC